MPATAGDVFVRARNRGIPVFCLANGFADGFVAVGEPVCGEEEVKRIWRHGVVGLCAQRLGKDANGQVVGDVYRDMTRCGNAEGEYIQEAKDSAVSESSEQKDLSTGGCAPLRNFVALKLLVVPSQAI